MEQYQLLANKLNQEFDARYQGLTALLGQVKEILSKVDQRCCSVDKENACDMCKDNKTVDEIMSFRHKLEKLSADLKTASGEDNNHNRYLKYLCDSVHHLPQNEETVRLMSQVSAIRAVNDENGKIKEEIENLINTANRHVAKYQVLLSKKDGKDKGRNLIDSFVKEHVNLKRFPLKDKNA